MDVGSHHLPAICGRLLRTTTVVHLTNHRPYALLSMRRKQGAGTPSRAAQSLGSLTTSSRVNALPDKKAARTSQSIIQPNHPPCARRKFLDRRLAVGAAFFRFKTSGSSNPRGTSLALAYHFTVPSGCSLLFQHPSRRDSASSAFGFDALLTGGKLPNQIAKVLGQFQLLRFD